MWDRNIRCFPETTLKKIIKNLRSKIQQKTYQWKPTHVGKKTFTTSKQQQQQQQQHQQQQQ